MYTYLGAFPLIAVYILPVYNSVYNYETISASVHFYMSVNKATKQGFYIISHLYRVNMSRLYYAISNHLDSFTGIYFFLDIYL